MKRIQSVLLILALNFSLFAQSYNWEILPQHNYSPIEIMHVFNNGDLLGELAVPKSLVISKNNGLSWENFYDGNFEPQYNYINSDFVFEEDNEGNLYFQDRENIYKFGNNSISIFFNEDDFFYIEDFKFLPNGNLLVADKRDLILMDKNGDELARESWWTHSVEFMIGDNGKNYAKHSLGATDYIVSFNDDLSMLTDQLFIPDVYDNIFYNQGRLFLDGRYSDNEGVTWQNLNSGLFGNNTFPIGEIISAENGKLIVLSGGEFWISLNNGDSFASLGIEDELSDYSSLNLKSNGEKICIVGYDCNRTITIISENDGQDFSAIQSSVGQSVSNNTAADLNSNLITEVCDDKYFIYSQETESWILRNNDENVSSAKYLLLNDNSFLRVTTQSVAKSADQGETWIEKVDFLNGYFIVKGNKVFGYAWDPLLGDVLYSSLDDGNTWQTSPLLNNQWLFSNEPIFDVTADNKVVVFDYLSSIFDPTFSVCDLQGEDCKEISLGEPDGLIKSVFASNASNAIFLFVRDSNFEDKLWVTYDEGITFETRDVPGDSPSVSSLYHSQNDNLIFTDGQDIYLSNDEGITWILISGNFPSVQSINNISFGLDNRLYISCDGPGVIKSAFQLKDISRVKINVYSDENMDCAFQNDELGIGNIKILLNDVLIRTTLVNGQLDLVLNDGVNKIELLHDENLYFACQDEFTIEVTESEVEEDLHIPLQRLIDCVSLESNVGSPLLRRCFENYLTAQVCNSGTVQSEESLIFLELDPYFNFIDCSLPLISLDGNTLQFKAEKLFPGECMNFRVNFEVSCESELGQEHCVSIWTELESNCETITASREGGYCMENIGSYDPNDKSIFVNGTQGMDYLEDGDDIEYLIRFQNTGTDTAFTVRIEDDLSERFDYRSVEPTVASHDYTWSLNDGMLEVLFENILLLDSTTNEPASHGYVKFKIRLKDEISLGDTFSNKAGIYFDFNEPIITNEVETLFGAPLSTKNISTNSFAPFPNPADKQINIPAEYIGYSMNIFTAHGQEVRFEESLNSNKIDISNFANGLYFVKLRQGSKQVYSKFLKQ